MSKNGDTKPKALKTEGSFRASQKAEKQAKQKQSSTVSSPGQAGFQILPSQVVEDLDVKSEFTKIGEQVELWAAKFTQADYLRLVGKGANYTNGILSEAGYTDDQPEVKEVLA